MFTLSFKIFSIFVYFFLSVVFFIRLCWREGLIALCRPDISLTMNDNGLPVRFFSFFLQTLKVKTQRLSEIIKRIRKERFGEFINVSWAEIVKQH